MRKKYKETQIISYFLGFNTIKISLKLKRR